MQETLRSCLARRTGEPPSLVAAGRPRPGRSAAVAAADLPVSPVKCVCVCVSNPPPPACNSQQNGWSCNSTGACSRNDAVLLRLLLHPPNSFVSVEVGTWRCWHARWGAWPQREEMGATAGYTKVASGHWPVVQHDISNWTHEVRHAYKSVGGRLTTVTGLGMGTTTALQ